MITNKLVEIRVDVLAAQAALKAAAEACREAALRWEQNNMMFGSPWARRW